MRNGEKIEEDITFVACIVYKIKINKLSTRIPYNASKCLHSEDTVMQGLMCSAASSITHNGIECHKDQGVSLWVG